jgi:mono/diheme cytochrome c family protein
MPMNRLFWIVLLFAAGTLQGADPLSAQQADGQRVFEASCAVGYCHGKDGRAGHGPRLRDRVWSRDYLHKTIVKGIPGSSMPAWGGKLSDEKIAAVIDYIFTFSKEEQVAVNTQEQVKTGAPDSTAEPAGRALFFDLMRDRNCGVCHRTSEAGSDIAPPFKGISGTSAQALLTQIKSKPASESNVRVRLKDGEEFCGINVEENRSSVRVYDLEADGPPVLRTIDQNSIQAVTTCPSFNVHAHNSEIYSSEELGSIVEFLRLSK